MRKSDHPTTAADFELWLAVCKLQAACTEVEEKAEAVRQHGCEPFGTTLDAVKQCRIGLEGVA